MTGGSLFTSKTSSSAMAARAPRGKRLEEEDASGGGGWRRRLEEEAGGDESGWRGVDGTAAADELFSKQPLTCISTHHP